MALHRTNETIDTWGRTLTTIIVPSGLAIAFGAATYSSNMAYGALISGCAIAIATGLYSYINYTEKDQGYTHIEPLPLFTGMITAVSIAIASAGWGKHINDRQYICLPTDNTDMSAPKENNATLKQMIQNDLYRISEPTRTPYNTKKGLFRVADKLTGNTCFNVGQEAYDTFHSPGYDQNHTINAFMVTWRKKTPAPMGNTPQ